MERGHVGMEDERNLTESPKLHLAYGWRHHFSSTRMAPWELLKRRYNTYNIVFISVKLVTEVPIELRGTRQILSEKPKSFG